MTRQRYIMMTVVLVLIQVVLNGSLSVSTYFFLAPVCFILLGLERGATSVKCMVIAFLVGLVVDVMSSGIPGLWSASLTAAVVPRLAIVSRRAWPDESGRYDMPSPMDMGTGVYLLYSLSVNVVFYVVYVAAEKMSFALTLADITRILISVVVNTVCLLAMALLAQGNSKN